MRKRSLGELAVDWFPQRVSCVVVAVVMAKVDQGSIYKYPRRRLPTTRDQPCTSTGLWSSADESETRKVTNA